MSGMAHYSRGELMRRRFFDEKRMLRGFGFSFLLVMAVIIVIPFVYLFATSLKDMGQYYSTDIRDMWFPSPLHFENYAITFEQVPLLTYIANSMWLGATQTLLSVFTSALVAYGFSRFKFPGRDFLFIILLATMMLPSEVLNIPLLLFYKEIGWTNTFYPLIVPYAFGGAWNIFLIRQMMLNVPKEYDEAAWLDGAGTFRTYWSITLPQVVPALIVTALFTFLWSWKDVLGPLFFIKSKEMYTLPLGLLFYESPTDKQLTIQLAAVVVALVPTLLIYLVGQRYFERGINVTDLK
jgi:multiple sugar transport system permease protein